MLHVLGFAFKYRDFAAPALMLLWSLLNLRKSQLTRRLPFRLIPIVFVILILVQLAYVPIKIVSPTNHTVVHAGDQVKLSVVLNPSLLSHLYPFINLWIYRCYTCTDWPRGVSTAGALTGSPYSFTIKLPPNQPAGEIFVDAYAATAMGDPAAIRSAGIGLVVK